jgi:hypothetical protein
LFNATAVSVLNALLGSVGKPGGVLFSQAWKPKSERPVIPPGLEIIRGTDENETLHYIAGNILSGLQPLQVLLLGGAHPVFA